MKKVGAKSKHGYWITDEGIALLEGWARDGLTDQEIAKNMGISHTTYYDYKNRFIEISDALKKGKEVSDRIVEGHAFKNATGFYYEEEVAFKLKRVTYNDRGQRLEKEEIGTASIRKWKPSDPTSVFFWLKNRMPKEWRDRFQQEIMTNEPIKVEMDYSKLSKEELKALKELLKKGEVKDDSNV